MTATDTFSVNGRAMPKFDRASIMRRAWALFRQTYRYPDIPFRSIGRPCFTSCLRKAWAEARKATDVAGTPADVKATRIAALQSAINLESYSENWSQARVNIAAMAQEIRQLTA